VFIGVSFFRPVLNKVVLKILGALSLGALSLEASSFRVSIISL